VGIACTAWLNSNLGNYILLSGYLSDFLSCSMGPHGGWAQLRYSCLPSLVLNNRSQGVLVSENLFTIYFDMLKILYTFEICNISWFSNLNSVDNIVREKIINLNFFYPWSYLLFLWKFSFFQVLKITFFFFKLMCITAKKTRKEQSHP
jgi:hypothetical protein